MAKFPELTTDPALAAIDGSLLVVVLWFALVAGSFFVFVIRPQRQKFAAQQQMLAELQIGDQVVTSAGILGEITSLSEDTATICIAPNVDVRFARAAILDRREETT